MPVNVDTNFVQCTISKIQIKRETAKLTSALITQCKYCWQKREGGNGGTSEPVFPEDFGVQIENITLHGGTAISPVYNLLNEFPTLNSD